MLHEVWRNCGRRCYGALPESGRSNSALLGRRKLVRQPQDESSERTQFESRPSLLMASEIGIISMMLLPMAIPLGTVLFAQRLSSSLQRRLRIERKGPPAEVRSFRKYLPYIEGKNGLEIGGPTGIFHEGDIVPVYGHIGTLDNCDFSISTAWAKHTQSFEFNPRKAPGKTFFCDGSALTPIGDSTYDVLLSSHNLEHFANPVKALKEWRRVLRPGGALILILPFYKATFDHRRKPTSVEHMFNDFEVKMGEDDLTHIPEILEKHDLTRDVGAGTP